MGQQHLTARMDVATVSDTVSDEKEKRWNQYLDSRTITEVISVMILMMMITIYIFSRCSYRWRKGKELDVPSLDQCYHSERAPLTAPTDLYAHYGSQWRKRHFTY